MSVRCSASCAGQAEECAAARQAIATASDDRAGDVKDILQSTAPSSAQGVRGSSAWPSWLKVGQPHNIQSDRGDTTADHAHSHTRLSCYLMFRVLGQPGKADGCLFKVQFCAAMSTHDLATCNQVVCTSFGCSLCIQQHAAKCQALAHVDSAWTQTCSAASAVQVKDGIGEMAEFAVRSLVPLISGDPDDDASFNLARPKGPLAGLWSVPPASNGAHWHNCPACLC